MSQLIKPQREYPFPIACPESHRRGGAILDYFPDSGFILRIYHPQPSPDLIRAVEKQEMKLYVYVEQNFIASVFSFGMPSQYFYCRFDPSLFPGDPATLFSAQDVQACVVNSKNNLVFGVRKPVKLPDTFIELQRRVNAIARTNENFSFSYLTWSGMIESRFRLDDLTLKGKLLMTWRPF